jgi:hypothetical protein
MLRIKFLAGLVTSTTRLQIRVRIDLWDEKNLSAPKLQYLRCVFVLRPDGSVP